MKQKKKGKACMVPQRKEELHVLSKEEPYFHRAGLPKEGRCGGYIKGGGWEREAVIMKGGGSH